MNLFKKYTDYDCKIKLYKIYCIKHDISEVCDVSRYGMFFCEFTCNKCKGFYYFARHSLSLNRNISTQTRNHEITLLQGTP